MTRQIVIPGECLVSVTFGDHLSGFGVATLNDPEPFEPVGNINELGLCLRDSIVVTPHYYHRDVKTSDYGARGAADVMADVGDCNIAMTLIHYDIRVLDVCVDQAMAGAGGKLNPGSDFPAGIMPHAGTLLGNGLPMFASGNYLVSLNLPAQQMTDTEGNQRPDLLPWHFPSAYLAETPAVFPLGTRASAVRLNWRAFPYLPLPTSPSFDFASSGVVLWNHTLDVIPDPPS